MSVCYGIMSVSEIHKNSFIVFFRKKRNGFNGDYHNTLPYDLFTAILSDSRAETLLKAGQYAMLRHYIRSSFDMGRFWASVKICIRNGYTISTCTNATQATPKW
jgi:hypothetical protein